MALKPENDARPDYELKARDGSTYLFQRKMPSEVPEDMDFAQQLRQAIAESGISQYQLAKAAEVPQGAISMFMNGGDLRLKTFNRLAYFMGFELRQLKSKAPKKKPAKKK
ncbi:helix-turn-helix domain-containing protein [Aeoliella sp. SH292]|uniref:helix-turn-helix domain-containing protein n=1 Tax=Aeoliella sp. SH292 TaxID=3454464 RepID=UPI003F9CE58C